MKALIGVMPLWDDEKESIWMFPGYLEGIQKAGGIPIVLPLSSDEGDLEHLVKMCDEFLFTGGHDVSPELYQEKLLNKSVVCCSRRDAMEKIVLQKVLELDKPLLGICRGIQFLNAALGGTLYQDLPTERPSVMEHHQQAPYDVPVHRVKILKDSPLFQCLGVEELLVNSYHHQAVRRMSPMLKPMAVSEDGLVEALYMPGHRFVWAVQWHPEFSYKTDVSSIQILQEFVRMSGK
ncbi:MAG: gamma-glutamyl-gamma-aminobutyrate hydrolase family protein [Hallerella succinigenes]|uniref:gamma-glutamyl-gamma-aminobutyrate hydrolase family protein n=1 Tax=Hallerella succinigenes TaxID=1896222 RepID=UPI0023F03A83|nr:gamma-glutamyl-gamma-aminobutyrate hydrolase family protein [Hallerella succinigenes]MDD6091176.1 gamma-glutamyl-gamma-aminobutyrate hydrolase family protein [Hallerella succinigenes]